MTIRIYREIYYNLPTVVNLVHKRMLAEDEDQVAMTTMRRLDANEDEARVHRRHEARHVRVRVAHRRVPAQHRLGAALEALHDIELPHVVDDAHHQLAALVVDAQHDRVVHDVEQHEERRVVVVRVAEEALGAQRHGQPLRELGEQARVVAVVLPLEVEHVRKRRVAMEQVLHQDHLSQWGGGQRCT